MQLSCWALNGAQCMLKRHTISQKQDAWNTLWQVDRSTLDTVPAGLLRPALTPSRQSRTKRRRKRRSGGPRHALRPQRRPRKLPRYWIFTLCSAFLWRMICEVQHALHHARSSAMQPFGGGCSQESGKRSFCVRSRPLPALIGCSVTRRRCRRRSRKRPTSMPRWRRPACSRPWRTVRLLRSQGSGLARCHGSVMLSCCRRRFPQLLCLAARPVLAALPSCIRRQSNSNYSRLCRHCRALRQWCPADRPGGGRGG